ncbi:MAG: hypothetical protein WC360_05830, partial [Opitutales bacterium]
MIKLFGKLFAGKPEKDPADDESAKAQQGINDPVGPVSLEPEMAEAATEPRRTWIGVDLDGTLAYFNGWRGFGHIGKPVPGMKARVLEWIAQGFEFKIFTARASVPEGIEPIKKWLAENGLP